MKILFPQSKSDINGFIRKYNTPVAADASTTASDYCKDCPVQLNPLGKYPYWASENNPLQNYTVHFTSDWLLCTSYSIQTSLTENCVLYPKTWVVEGFDGYKWKTISTIANSGFTGCSQTTTFSFDVYGAFNKFRFTMTGTNSQPSDHFLIGKLDFFGHLCSKNHCIDLQDTKLYLSCRGQIHAKSFTDFLYIVYILSSSN